MPNWPSQWISGGLVNVKLYVTTVVLLYFWIIPWFHRLRKMQTTFTHLYILAKTNLHSLRNVARYFNCFITKKHQQGNSCLVSYWHYWITVSYFNILHHQQTSRVKAVTWFLTFLYSSELPKDLLRPQQTSTVVSVRCLFTFLYFLKLPQDVSVFFVPSEHQYWRLLRGDFLSNIF